MGNLRTLVQVYGRYRYHILALSVLGVVGAILDGVAINVAVPSLSFLVNKGAELPTDFISKCIMALFGVFHISFTFRHLLELIALLLLARSLALIAFGYIRGYITGDFLAKESSSMLYATLSAPWSFLLSQRVGHVQNVLERDLQRSSNLLEAISQVIQSSTGFLMYLLVALNISASMTLFTLGGGIVLAFLLRPLLRRTQQAGEEMAQTDKSVSQFVTEHLIGMKTVKAARLEEPVLAQGNQLFMRLRRLYTRIAFVRSMATSLFQPFAMIFVIVLFTLTYHSNTFNLVSFAATLYLIQKIFTYLESAQASLHSMRELIPYAEHVLRFKEELGRVRKALPTGSEPFSFTREIRFSDVTFRYTGDRPVLERVSFTLTKGATVAVVGPSGSGKTSIADLLLGLFVPQSGSITIDGVELSMIDPSEFRAHVGYVAQDSFLLNDTIEANVRFYREHLSEEDIARALEKAHLKEFIATLPDGLATVVGDRGVMLSGGQRQRIALARALAGSPDLLILDEATSALDSESERVIQEAIEALHGSVTVLMIAHRLSTIERADQVLVLEHGAIVESGTPQALHADPSSYLNRSPARK